MNVKRFALAALAMGTLIAALFFVAADEAHAGPDHRPCVSKVEFQSITRWATREYVEHRWEVEGMGRRSNIIPVTYIYPRCGYDLNEAWYAGVYRAGALDLLLAWKKPGAVAHGHLRGES